MDHVFAVLGGTWLVLGRMGPYLLGGFLLAGVLAVLIPSGWVQRHLGRRGWRPIVGAALVGVPLPLCSCSVLPVAMGMRRRGAGRGATAAFLLSTPQTGVDSIAVTWALLGPWVAVYRAGVAFVTGIVGGLAVGGLARGPAGEPPPAEEGEDDSRTNPLVAILRYGLVTLPRDVALALLLGALIAGAIGALVPAGWLATWLGGGVLALLAMMAIGVPLYVCATASVPIAIGFMHAGASIGAAFAFLVAGPATNAATIGAIWRFLGGRATVIYLATVAVVALAGGWLLDVILADYELPAAVAHHGEHGLAWWGHVLAGILVAVLAVAWLSKFFGHKPPTCDHCEPPEKQDCCHA